MILQTTNVTDITFRIMDVVLIVGGVISVLTSFFVLRYQTQSNKEKITYLEAEVLKLEKAIEKHGEIHGDFKERIFKKMDEQNQELHKLALSIGEFKTQIIQEINKK